MTNWHLVREQITSKWNRHLPTWFIFSSVWCLNSALLLGLGVEIEAESGNLLVPGLFANLVAGVCIITAIAIWNFVQPRLTVNVQIKLVITLIVGALIGLIKGLVTYSIFWQVTKGDFSQTELIKASAPAVLIGFFTIAIFGIVGSISQEFFQQRDLLVSENVARRYAEEASWPIENDVKSFIAGARIQLAEVGESSAEMKRVLIDLAQSGVRPISHKLWQEEKRNGTKFAFRYFLQTTMRGHQFPEKILALSTFPLIFPQQLEYFGLQTATIHSLTQCLVIYLAFTIGRRVPLTGMISGPLVFLLTPLLAVIGLDLVSQFLFGPIPELDPIGIDVVLYFGLLLGSLLLTSAINAPRTIAEMNLRLKSFDTSAINLDAEKVIKLIRKRETAELLHGYVQNQFMTAALKVKEDQNTNLLIRTSIDDLLNKLEDGSLQATQVKPTDPRQIIVSLEEVWRGVVAVELIKIDIPDQIQRSISQQTMQLLDRLINELIANAHRHGLATKIEISLTLDGTDLLLYTSDNGIGPRQGHAGLGTALLNAATAGRWEIKLGANQIGSVVSCRISI